MAGRFAEGWLKYKAGNNFDPVSRADILAAWTGLSGYTLQASSLGGQEIVLGGGATMFKTLDHQAVWIIGDRIMLVSGTGLTLDALIYQGRNNGTSLVQLVSNIDGTLTAYAGGVAIGTSSIALHSNKHYYVEIKVTLTGTTNINVAVVINLDGNPVITGNVNSGINQNTLTSGTATINNHLIGSGNTVSLVHKDIYVCDGTGSINNDFLGDVQIGALRPNGDVVSGWTPNTGTVHFSLVNDFNPPDPTFGFGSDSDGTFVSSGTVSSQDIWDWEDIVTFSGQIKFIQLSMFARKDAEGTKKFQIVTGNTGSENQSPDFSVEDDYVYHQYILDKDPGTGLPWTVTGFNAKRFGIKVTV